MKIRCPHCQQITEIEDCDVREYINTVPIMGKDEAQAARARKPRPGSKGPNNWRNKLKAA